MSVHAMPACVCTRVHSHRRHAHERMCVCERGLFLCVVVKQHEAQSTRQCPATPFEDRLCCATGRPLHKTPNHRVPSAEAFTKAGAHEEWGLSWACAPERPQQPYASSLSLPGLMSLESRESKTGLVNDWQAKRSLKTDLAPHVLFDSASMHIPSTSPTTLHYITVVKAVARAPCA